MSVEFYWIVVALITIVSAARLTRLVVVDKFPPVAWLRDKYEDLVQDSPWWWLTNCGYCLAPYFVAALGLWGWLAGVYKPLTHFPDSGAPLIWFIINGWLAGSYLASMTMAYDGADDATDAEPDLEDESV